MRVLVVEDHVALANRMDIFLHAYLAMNAAYAARAFLSIGRALGRSPGAGGA